MNAMTTIQETRTLSATDLRSLCIREGWYTRGTNKEYTNLLTEMIKYGTGHLNTDDLVAIGQDIITHSLIDPQMGLTDIMWYINQACRTVFREVEVDQTLDYLYWDDPELDYLR